MNTVEDPTTSKPSWLTLISAMFLIGGTCIGGGMLALPLVTGVVGFVPSMAAMLVVWLMMTLSGLLFVEISLWLPPGAHVVTMASELLGKGGKVLVWILYLFISYSSIVAYAAAVGVDMANLLFTFTGLRVTADVGSFLFVLLFTSSVFVGRRFVGLVNTVLFLALVGAYILLVGIGLPEVGVENLSHQMWSGIGFTVPLLLAAFSYHAIVPSMTPYLNRDRRSLQIAIVGGTLISFVIYLMWEVLVLGTVAFEGPYGLREAFLQGVPATDFYSRAVESPFVSTLAVYFAFFALVTSYLGMTLGLYDFLSDGLGVKERGVGKLILGALIVLPTYYCATNFARIFLVALDTSGGFGDAILNGALPVAMVWVGRYRRGLTGKSVVPGGRPVLLAILLFYACAVGLEFASQVGWLNLDAWVAQRA